MSINKKMFKGIKGSEMRMYQKEVIINNLIVGSGRSGISMSNSYSILSSGGRQAPNNKIEGVESMQYDNSIVGFINGLAIIKDDNCDLFFTAGQAEHLALGDFVIEADLKPLSELEPETRKLAEEKFA